VYQSDHLTYWMLSNVAFQITWYNARSTHY